eukprot:1569943-Pleurochrysis_carterae.AAC.1
MHAQASIAPTGEVEKPAAKRKEKMSCLDVTDSAHVLRALGGGSRLCRHQAMAGCIHHAHWRNAASGNGNDDKAELKEDEDKIDAGLDEDAVNYLLPSVEAEASIKICSRQRRFKWRCSS